MSSSVWVSDSTFYAAMGLSGSVVGKQTVLDARTIDKTNGASGGGCWCLPTLLLAPDGVDTLF